MKSNKLWMAVIAFTLSGAWIGCEPMPAPSPPIPAQESKPADAEMNPPASDKDAEVTPDKPSESPDATSPPSNEGEKKVDESKTNDPESSDT